MPSIIYSWWFTNTVIYRPLWIESFCCHLITLHDIETLSTLLPRQQFRLGQRRDDSTDVGPTLGQPTLLSGWPLWAVISCFPPKGPVKWVFNMFLLSARTCCWTNSRSLVPVICDAMTLTWRHCSVQCYTRENESRNIESALYPRRTCVLSVSCQGRGNLDDNLAWNDAAGFLSLHLGQKFDISHMLTATTLYNGVYLFNFVIVRQSDRYKRQNFCYIFCRYIWIYVTLIECIA